MSAPGPGLEIWRGGVATWECDEMGHMNVRFYVLRAMEGLAGLAAALGMPGAYAAAATATLLPREHHIRFLHEARAGAPLHMTGAVLEMGETGARFLQTLVHSDSGAVAATFQTEVLHVAPGDHRPFPWPTAARRAAERLTVEAPPEAAPRGLKPGPSSGTASLAEAERLGLEVMARGAVLPADCDVFGRMRADQVLARIAQGLAHYGAIVRRDEPEAEPDPARGTGGAMVEYRVLYHDWPKPGDRVEMRSGLVKASPMTRRMAHWLLDPTSGRPWATAEMIALVFDMRTRRARPLDEAVVRRLAAREVAGLSI